MTNKYQLRPPRNLREQIEFIAMEMRPTPADERRPSMKTIKDLLVDLFTLHRSDKFRRELDQELAQKQMAFPLLVFACICFLLIFLGSDTRTSDFTLLDNNKFFLRMLGIGLAAVFIGVVIERTEAFGMVWRYNIAKLLASVALSALVIYSAGRASSIINGVFGIDASAFPYARALLAGWIAFVQIAKPVLLLVLVFASVHLFCLVGWIKERFWPANKDKACPEFPWLSIWITVLSAVVVSNAYNWLYESLNDAQQPTKIYQMARTLDFNSQHRCVNVPAEVNVVFLGSEQSKVLVDASAELVLTFKDFISQPASEWERPAKYFPVVECVSSGLK